MIEFIMNLAYSGIFHVIIALLVLALSLKTDNQVTTVDH